MGRAAESPMANPSVVSNTGTVPCGACSAQLYSPVWTATSELRSSVNLPATEQTLLLAAEAGGQHRLIIQPVLGGQ